MSVWIACLSLFTAGMDGYHDGSGGAKPSRGGLSLSQMSERHCGGCPQRGHGAPGGSRKRQRAVGVRRTEGATVDNRVRGFRPAQHDEPLSRGIPPVSSRGTVQFQGSDNGLRVASPALSLCVWPDGPASIFEGNGGSDGPCWRRCLQPRKCLALARCRGGGGEPRRRMRVLVSPGECPPRAREARGNHLQTVEQESPSTRGSQSTRVLRGPPRAVPDAQIVPCAAGDRWGRRGRHAPKPAENGICSQTLRPLSLPLP